MVTSKAVIKALKEIFARLGIQDEVVSDNGPKFSSAEFEVSTKTWSFSQVTSSPTHGQSDGKVQSAVKTVKRPFKKCQESGHSEHLSLLDWRNTLSESAQAQYSTWWGVDAKLCSVLLEPYQCLATTRRKKHERWWQQRNSSDFTTTETQSHSSLLEKLLGCDFNL